MAVLGLHFCARALVVASGGHSSSQCAGLSLSWPLLLRSTGSRRASSVIVTNGLSCSAARGIFPDQGSNPCPLHWQADSQPLRHQGSPSPSFEMQVWLFHCLIHVSSWPLERDLSTWNSPVFLPNCVLPASVNGTAITQFLRPEGHPGPLPSPLPHPLHQLVLLTWSSQYLLNHLLFSISNLSSCPHHHRLELDYHNSFLISLPVSILALLTNPGSKHQPEWIFKGINQPHYEMPQLKAPSGLQGNIRLLLSCLPAAPSISVPLTEPSTPDSVRF